MVGTIKDFLNSTSFGGTPVTQGSTDLLGGGDLTKLSEQQLAQNNAPFLFAQLLQAAMKPGGFLSETATDTAFASQASAQADTFQGQQDDLASSLVAQGVNPTFAAQILGENRRDANAGLLQLRAQLETQRQEREFGAGQAFANVTANAAAQTKQNELQSRYVNKQVAAQKKAGRYQLLGSLAGLGLNFLPGGQFASLFGGGAAATPSPAFNPGVPSGFGGLPTNPGFFDGPQGFGPFQ
jgi:hypothetical protein